MDLMPEWGQKQERPGVRPAFKEEEETQPQSDEEQSDETQSQSQEEDDFFSFSNYAFSFMI